jgi:hypothetical protein
LTLDTKKAAEQTKEHDVHANAIDVPSKQT